MAVMVDGVESLRQRIVQALRFRISTWLLDRLAGLDYNLLIGHRISPALAASTLSSAIREEGGDRDCDPEQRAVLAGPGEQGVPIQRPD